MSQPEFSPSPRLPGNKPLVAYFFHPNAVVLFNMLQLVILGFGFIYMLELFFDPANDFDAQERTLDGIATIFVAYGVALEERESVLKFFGYYPRFFSPREAHIDHLCHDYGVLFLIIGLLVETAVQIVKIPDRLINTAELETAVFIIGGLLLLLAGYYLVVSAWHLLKSPETPK
jgi:hypothetical protein